MNQPVFSVRSSLPTCYCKQESLKKCAYEKRVGEVEHSSFTPWSSLRPARTFYKRLASRLTVKWDYPYPSTLSWLHSRLTFSLLCSAFQCIRSARSGLHPQLTRPSLNSNVPKLHDLIILNSLYCHYFVLIFTLHICSLL